MHQYIWTMRLARVGLALGMLGGSSLAHALGLGNFVLHSGLDEPLDADVEITTATPAELKSLKATLAPRNEFNTAGIERPAFLTSIKYTLSQRPDGRPFLKLTTAEPIREPYLQFLMQVEWAGGRLVREYTTLLDPPQLASKEAPVSPPELVTPAPVEAEPAVVDTTPPPSVAATPETAPASRPRATPAPRIAREETARPAIIDEAPAAPESDLLGPPETVVTNALPTDSASPVPQTDVGEATPAGESDWATQTEYRVKPGDTVGKIARNLRQDNSLSAEQVMLALLKTNKSAFFGNNVNNLKAGKILKVPSRDAVEATSKQEALKEFRAQYNSWQEYRLKVAAAAETVKVAGDTQGEVRGEIADKPPGAAADAGSKDMLKIVRAEGDKTTPKSAGGEAGRLPVNERQMLVDKVSTLEEAITSKELENKELRDRLTQLEAQVKNAKRLVEIENKELAKTQDQAAENKKPEVASAPAPTPASAEAPKVAEAPQAPAPAAKPPKKASPAPPLAPEPGFLDSLLGFADNGLMLPILGAVGAVVGGALIIYYRRRRKAMAEFGESILSGGLNLNSEGSATTGEADKSADVSFLSDFSQGGMGNIHTDEVDPIAEAEVYLAYGRDEQAEEILKEAVVKDPTRHELRLKLLEIYQQRNDLRAFETVAEELYAALEGKGGKVWEKAEEMGYKMNPQNPLFRGAGAAKDMPLADTVTPFDSGLSLHASAPESDPVDLNLDVATAAVEPGGNSEEFRFDLDFANEATTRVDMRAVTSEQTAEVPADSIDFDFSSLTSTPSEDSNTELPVEPQASGNEDFNLSFESQPSPEDNNIDFGALTEGMDTSEAGEMGSDEIATKLDLAKAYIDMGDPDGARSILDEVLAEGSDAQKRQAAELAAQIAA